MSETHTTQKIDLDALEAALVEAKPICGSKLTSHHIVSRGYEHLANLCRDNMSPIAMTYKEESDAIAAAYTALPALLAELRELRRQDALLAEFESERDAQRACTKTAFYVAERLQADLDTVNNHADRLREQLHEAKQQIAAVAMLIAESVRGAEIVAATERDAPAEQNLELRGAVKLGECGHSRSLTTGVAAADRVYYAHKARLECIEAAIHQLGRLRNEWGFSIDALPDDINEARIALWKAYQAEQKRRPVLVPESDR